jgi:hypothetical protein
MPSGMGTEGMGIGCSGTAAGGRGVKGLITGKFPLSGRRTAVRRECPCFILLYLGKMRLSGARREWRGPDVYGDTGKDTRPDFIARIRRKEACLLPPAKTTPRVGEARAERSRQKARYAQLRRPSSGRGRAAGIPVSGRRRIAANET